MAAVDDAESRQMLEVCGFTYDSARDVFTHAGDGRTISAAIVAQHTPLWVAQWITKTLVTG
jgi:hypothetical protein